MVKVLQKGNKILEMVAVEVLPQEILGAQIKDIIAQMKDVLENTEDAVANL